MIPTIENKESYSKIISSEILAYWHKLIYERLLGVTNEFVPNDKIKLSSADRPLAQLLQKILNGDIIYDGEYFSGKFDSQLSKQIKSIGGSWDASRKSFKCTPGKLTPDLKVAISASKDRLEKLHKGLLNELGQIEDEVDDSVEAFDLSKGLDSVIAGLQGQALKAMKAIGVKYTLTDGQKQVIKKEYTDNMKLYIKTWSHEHIKNLRAEVEENSMQGYRYNRLKSALQYRYGTTVKKSEFLARQETSLFMAKFRQQRFLDAGVNFYQWDTVGDRKVRKTHKELDGKIFQFGDPPIVDVPTGRKAEPGEDYNCRCIARPTTKPVHKVGGYWRFIDG